MALKRLRFSFFLSFLFCPTATCWSTSLVPLRCVLDEPSPFYLFRFFFVSLPSFTNSFTGFFFFFSFLFLRLRCRSEENRRKESEILFFFFFFFFWTHNPQRITNKQTNKQTNKNIELRWNGHRRRNAVAFHARPAISMSATRRRQNHPISSFFFCFFSSFPFFFLWGFQNN